MGAGAGGLGAGATLARAGVRVLVLEQHDKPGGYMTCFERGGFRFEVSLHMMDALAPGGWTHELMGRLGILDRIKPIRLDPMYRLVGPGLSLDVPADLDAYRGVLQRQFPEAYGNIEPFLGTLEAVGAEMEGLRQAQEQSPLRFWLKALSVPISCRAFWTNRNATAAEMAGPLLADERASAAVMTLVSFLGLPPSRASGLYFAGMWNSYHRHGAFYPEGGSQSVSDALAAVIRENGGEVRLNTRVEKILVRDGRAAGVRTAEGEEIPAAFVISNADGVRTYLDLVGREHLPRKFAARLEKLEPGISLTQVYLGLNLDLAKTGLGRVGEVFYNPSYDLEALFKNAGRMEIEQMSLALAFYSNTDPTCAPPGKSVVVLTTATPYDWQERWRRDEGEKEYQQLKEMVAGRMIRVAEKIVPGLGDAIEVLEIGSPLTMERYTLNTGGAFMGWAPTPEQSMLKRLSQKGPVKNLLLAGAWTFPGGGQSACLFSGHLAAREILGRLR